MVKGNKRAKLLQKEGKSYKFSFVRKGLRIAYFYGIFAL